MRNKCIESFNKEYGLNAVLKDKQKGRNIDYRVSQMADYDELKKIIINKDKKINKLNNQTKNKNIKSEKIKDTIDYWKDKFQRVVKYIHDKIHGIFGDKDDKYKEMADNLFINGIMDEKEYNSVINNREKNRDDFER